MFDKVPERVARRVADAALDATFEWICESPKELAEMAFSENGPLRAELGLVSLMPSDADNYPPLSVLVREFESGKVLLHYDVIRELTTPVFPEFDQIERGRLSRAIATLEAAIEQLKSYEAERLQAQS